MKKKENLSLGRKNLVVVLLAFVLVISSMLTACGSSASQTTPATKEEVVVDKVEEKTTEEVAQAETVVETTVEEVVESTEEVETFESAGAWAQSVDRAEPKMTIWNEITKEGIILENEQKYSLKEGDQLIICTKEEKSALSIHSDLSKSEYKVRSSSSYTQFIFNKVFLEETLFEVVITVAGTEYPFSVTLISESAASSVAEESESTDMSGKDWASSLNYEEPKLIAWNDETGTREVIENGGQYNMQQGDVLAVYYPTGYFVFNASPVDFSGGLTMLDNFVRMEYILPSESKVINLEVEILNPQDELENFNYVITTP